MNTKDICSQCLRGKHHLCMTDACACVEGDCAEPEDPPIVTWEDPPLRGGTEPLLSTEAKAELEANPGRWARIKTCDKPTSANSIQSRFNKGIYIPITKDQWEMVTRKVGTGSAVYLRFVDQPNVKLAAAQ